MKLQKVSDSGNEKYERNRILKSKNGFVWKAAKGNLVDFFDLGDFLLQSSLKRGSLNFGQRSLNSKTFKMKIC
jgi:hypothetical protein